MKRIISTAMVAAAATLAMPALPAGAAGGCLSGPTPDGGHGAIVHQAAVVSAGSGEGFECWFVVPAGRGATLDYEATSINRWSIYTTGTTHPSLATPEDTVTLVSSDASSPPAGWVSVSLAPGDYVVLSVGVQGLDDGDPVCTPAVCAYAGTLGAHV